MADFTPEAIARIQRVVPYVERSMRNVRGRRARWQGGGGNQLAYFELKTDLTPGGTADAYPLDDDGDPITDDADVVFEVKDARGIYRGRAKDAYSSPHDQGSRGEARLRNGVWEIVHLTPHALVIHGQLTADLATTDATFTIDGVQVMQPTGAIIVDQDPAGSITVYNTFARDGDNNEECCAVWNEETDDWEECKIESDGSITIRDDCETVSVPAATVLEFECDHFVLAEITEGEGEAEHAVGVAVDLFAGQSDALIVHNGSKWLKLAPPAGDAVLVYDSAQAAGARVKWVSLEEFACPEEA